MTHFSPADPEPAEPDDRDPIRAILRATPTLAVPRDFTLDPAVYGQHEKRNATRRVLRPAISGRVWHGLAASAAILIVIGAALFTQSGKQPASLVESSAGRAQSALAATSIPPTLIAALPTIVAPQVNAKIVTQLPIIMTPTPIVPVLATPITRLQSAAQSGAAQSAPFSGNVPGSAQIAPQSNSPADSARSSANAASGAVPALPQAAVLPPTNPAMKIGQTANADSAQVDTMRAQFVSFLQGLILWLQSLLRL